MTDINELEGRWLRMAVAEEVFGWTGCRIPKPSVETALGTPYKSSGEIDIPKYEQDPVPSQKLLHYLVYQMRCTIETLFKGDEHHYWITAPDVDGGARIGPFVSHWGEHDEAALARAAVTYMRNLSEEESSNSENSD